MFFYFANVQNKVGEIYEMLCREYPLVPVTKRNHGDAMKVLTELTEKVIMEKIPKSELAQVNQYLEVLGDLIHKYEQSAYKTGKISGAEILQHLIDDHDLTQSDIPEIGAQPNVSSVLNGSRKINWQQAKALSQRFGVEASVFME